ncbi:MAG: hypothetical protein LH654_06105, partial [Thermoleophilia bacterium]|nr:hypothetical protein [Thermoleophilia bacterium]
MEVFESAMEERIGDSKTSSLFADLRLRLSIAKIPEGKTPLAPVFESAMEERIGDSKTSSLFADLRLRLSIAKIPEGKTPLAPVF